MRQQKTHIEQIRTLATVRDGETLVVEDVLFDANRMRLAAAGILPGDRVRCRRATPGEVQLETERGIVVSVERSWANFVQVSDAHLLASSDDQPLSASA